MFEVIKVLNNNALLAFDNVKEKEVVFLGKGIGFSAKAQQKFEVLANTKKYYIDSQTEKGPASELLNNVDALFMEIAAEILAKAEEKFHDIDTNILLPLSDHIAFAIQRMDQNMDIHNPFANDIRLLFPDEYEIALYGKKLIQERCSKIINDDEVSYITLHIHSSITDDNVTSSMQTAIIIQETIEKIEHDFDMKIDNNSLAYSRLLTHIKYMLARAKQQEHLTLDMEDYVKQTFPYAYDVAKQIVKNISAILQCTLEDTETGYLALHIERIRKSE